jgi:ABC-type sugar transport system substrate-binding protein
MARKLRSAGWTAVVVMTAAILTACASNSSPGTAGAGSPPASSPGAAEHFNAPPALLAKALGNPEASNVPQPVLAAVYRAGLPVSASRLQLALKCWKDKICETGTGGKLTVALADGFGENVWREITHMEFVLQALTYPQIGKIIYTSAQGDTQKAISDFRSLIAQNANVIVTFADAGEALLPTVREAAQRRILVVPYISGVGGTPGRDYLSYVAEDLCRLGKNFAGVLNSQLPSGGDIALLGGTPGNPLSHAWQTCETPALDPNIKVVARADTNWTRQGTLQAVSSILSQYPALKGISYEYADGFLGGLQAYQAASKSVDITLTLRTDEQGLFCQWKQMNDPNFKIYYSSGGSFDSRIALTTAMMKLSGASVPANVVVPAKMRQVDASSCNTSIPLEAPASTLVPENVLAAMYPHP